MAGFVHVHLVLSQHDLGAEGGPARLTNHLLHWLLTPVNFVHMLEFRVDISEVFPTYRAGFLLPVFRPASLANSPFMSGSVEEAGGRRERTHSGRAGGVLWRATHRLQRLLVNLFPRGIFTAGEFVGSEEVL